MHLKTFANTAFSMQQITQVQHKEHCKSGFRLKTCINKDDGWFHKGHKYDEVLSYRTRLVRIDSPEPWKHGTKAQTQELSKVVPHSIAKSFSLYDAYGFEILWVNVLVDRNTSTAVVENYNRKQRPESDILKQHAKLAIIKHLQKEGISHIVPLKEFMDNGKHFETHEKIPILAYLDHLEKLAKHPDPKLAGIKLFCEGPL